MREFKRFFPVLILACVVFIFYFAQLGEYFSFRQLKENRAILVSLVGKYPYLSKVAFTLVYAFLTAISFPGGAFVSLFGGFLFPQPWSTLCVVLGATLGAIGIFLIARSSFGELLRKRAGSRMERFRKGFEGDAWSYLLFLRLVPLFPFWFVNLAPALVGVRLKVFIWTTFLGIIPGAFAFTQAGAGLGEIFERGEEFSLGIVFNFKMRVALIALALIALIPALIKKLSEDKKR